MAEAAKALFGGKAEKAQKPDKLAHKKQQEKEAHELLKQQQRDAKAATEAKAAEHKALLKEERQLHDTKRAHTDARHAAKREEHKETGEACEHGVWRCKICNPHHK